MISIFVYAVLMLSVLGVALAAVLYFMAQKFKVVEDPRIDQVEALLPGANCAGCGFTGCRAFAEKCVQEESLDALFCPVGGNAVMGQVAHILGKTVEEKAPMLAVLRCGGGHGKREQINRYDGMTSCAVAAALYDGDTGCRYGCLMLGDCAKACSFGGVRMDEQTGLPVVNESMCSACGACMKACPKKLFEPRNKGLKGRRIYVGCMNTDKGAVARKACQVACIGCGKCVKVCAFEAIKVENYLAYIDFNKCKLCRKCVSECPTGAIIEVNFPPKKPVAVTTESTDNPVKS